MIRSITIKNFQAHAKLRIDLDPAATTLVGPSDAGKSAVIRALRWLAFNRPQGDAFIKHGKDCASVRVKVDETDVLRERGKGMNTYDLDGHRYQSFGADVPADVAAALNLDPDLNVQRQHDAPFWFLLSPGEVSRELNAVVNLGLIDATLANVAAALRQAKAEAAVAKARLADAEAERDWLAWVPAAAVNLGKIGDLAATAAQTRLKSSRLRDLLEGVAGAARRRGNAATALKSGVAAQGAADAWLAAAKRRDRLAYLLDELGRAEDRLAGAKVACEDAEIELAMETKGQNCPVCGKEMG